MADKIDIKSNCDQQFSTKLIIQDITYIVATDLISLKRPQILTKIYKDGAIVETFTRDVSVSISAAVTLDAQMAQCHQEAIATMKNQKLELKKSPAAYVNEAMALFGRNNFTKALNLLAEGLRDYPDDPFILSQHGYLRARVKNEHKAGINDCLNAIRGMKKTVFYDIPFIYPNLYLNLGRTYLEAGDKDNAVKIYQIVLDIDDDNQFMRFEMRKLGIRKRPVFPFLNRDNPLNKYLGILRQWMIPSPATT